MKRKNNLMKDDRFLLILLAIFAFVSFLVLKPFLTYILFSIVFTVVAYPLYERIKSALRFASLSAIILIILIILLIVVPSIYLTIRIFAQTRDLISGLEAAEFRQLDILENRLESSFGIELNFAEAIKPSLRDLSTTIRSFIIGNIITFTRAIATFVGGIILMFFVMFYLFVDGKRIVQQVKNQLPLEEKHKDHLFKRANETTQALFLGIFLTAVVQGIVAWVGYLLFGVPNAILLGFLTALFSIIPFLGPPVIYVPASLFLLSQGNLFGGFGLLVYNILLVSQIDNILRPLLVRLRTKIHPLTVILGIVGGVAFLGFSGIFIGPLILSLFQEILSTYQIAKKKSS